MVATGIAIIWARDAMAAANAQRTAQRGLPRPLPARPRREPRAHGVGHPRPRLLEAASRPWRPTSTPWTTPCSSPPAPTTEPSARARRARPEDAGAWPATGPTAPTPTSCRRSTPPYAREVLGPDPLLAPEQTVVLETDPARAREIAPRHTARSTSGLPNYVNNLRRLGFTEDDFADGGSDRLVDAIVAWGDGDACRAGAGPPRRRRRPRVHPARRPRRARARASSSASPPRSPRSDQVGQPLVRLLRLGVHERGVDEPPRDLEQPEVHVRAQVRRLDVDGGAVGRSTSTISIASPSSASSSNWTSGLVHERRRELTQLRLIEGHAAPRYAVCATSSALLRSPDARHRFSKDRFHRCDGRHRRRGRLDVRLRQVELPGHRRRSARSPRSSSTRTASGRPARTSSST